MEVHRRNKLKLLKLSISEINTEIKYFLRKWVIRKVTHELEFLTIFTKPPQPPPPPHPPEWVSPPYFEAEEAQ